MYCTKCGNEIADTSKFCVVCGTAVAASNPTAANEPTPVSSPVPPSQGYQNTPTASYSPPVAQPRKSSKAPIAIALVIAVAIIGGAVAYSMGAFSQGESAGSQISVSSSAAEHASGLSGQTEQDGQDAQESAQETASTVTADEPEAAAEPEEQLPEAPAQAEDQPEAPQEAPASSQLDLSNPATYENVNKFLSNFSEVEFGDMPDVNTISDEELAVFAVRHVMLNSWDEIEQSPMDNFGWGLPPDNYAGGADGLRNNRLSASRVDDLVNRYFGRSVNFDAITYDQYPGWVVYQDGYVYFGTTGGPRMPWGVTVATSAVDQDDGTMLVHFDVYFGPGYDPQDASLYSLPVGDLMQRLGASEPKTSGSAVLRWGPENDYTGGLVLVSYDIA